MDGKGRWRDNVYIERFWRSIKYECIFLNEYSMLPALENGLRSWIKRYNTWRPHQALGNKTPRQFYQEGLGKVGPQEESKVLTSPCTTSTPKVLDALLQVFEVSSLCSENLSNLALRNQNLALTTSSPLSYIAFASIKILTF